MVQAIFRSLRLLSGRQKLAVTMLAFATLLLNALDVVAIAILGAVGSLAVSEAPALAFLIESQTRENAILILLVVATGLFTVKTIGGIYLARVRYEFLARLEVRASQIIASFIFKSDLTKFKSYSRPHLEWSILRSTDMAFGRIIGQSLQLFAEASLAISILTLFFFVDWLSALLVITYFSAILVIFQIVTRAKTKKTGEEFADGSVDVSQAISDLVVAFREITVSSKVEVFLSKIRRARSVTANANAAQLYMQAIPRLVVELGLIAGALGFAAFQFVRSSGDLDFGLLGVFIFGSLRIMSSLLPIQRAYMQLLYDAPQARAAQDLVAEASRPDFFDNTTGFSPDAKLEELGHTEHGLAVSLQNVTFSFRDDERRDVALNGISLEVAAGTTVAIIGPSGAGKSTLVDLILGLHAPDSGKVLCSGHSPDFARSSIAGVMGYVPQKPGVVSGSLLENIALGCPPEEIDSENLWSAIRAAELETLVSSLPDGVHSSLGGQLDSLSGGQLQRIGLARALYSRPRLLVLDEATSALDADTEASISDGLSKLSGQTTVIIVAHRLSTIQKADKVVVMDQGEIIGEGLLRELVERIPMVARYIELMNIH